MKHWQGLRSIRGELFWLCFTVFAAVFQAHGDLPVIYRMRRVDVSSEAIRSIGYHHKTQTLEVQFQSHETYRYAHVPVIVYEALLAAESKGHYFQDHIRGRYDYWKVMPPR